MRNFNIEDYRDEFEFFNGVTVSLICPCSITFGNYELKVVSTSNGWGTITDKESLTFLEDAIEDVVRFKTKEEAFQYINKSKTLN